jgi:hypothetical protein
MRRGIAHVELPPLAERAVRLRVLEYDGSDTPHAERAARSSVAKPEATVLGRQRRGGIGAARVPAHHRADLRLARERQRHLAGRDVPRVSRRAQDLLVGQRQITLARRAGDATQAHGPAGELAQHAVHVAHRREPRAETGLLEHHAGQLERAVHQAAPQDGGAVADAQVEVRIHEPLAEAGVLFSLSLFRSNRAPAITMLETYCTSSGRRNSRSGVPRSTAASCQLAAGSSPRAAAGATG